MGYATLALQVRWGTLFLVDFSTQFDANLAPSWATLVQELVLDGLVVLREAQRINFPASAGTSRGTGVIHVPVPPINKNREGGMNFPASIGKHWGGGN